MSILVDVFPYTINVGGREVPIRCDFATGIKFSELVENQELDYKQKLEECLKLYLIDIGDVVGLNINDVITAILDFYSCNEKAEKGAGRKGERVLSYSQDANFIYSAFYEQYGIDLQEAQLHWWKFKALLDGLSDKTMIKKIMNIRAMDTSKLDKEQRKHYQSLKRHYKLQQQISKREADEIEELETALMNGGNISNLL